MNSILRPAYQAVRHLETGELLYCEALARVKADGVTGHTRLIELGEAVGFIGLVDVAMLEHAASALEVNPRAVVAVNVSGATIDCAANEYLAEVFRRLRVTPRVVFEITETREIRNERMLECFLGAVRLLGAKVAADDYGSGFCTAEFVARTRADYVKLSGRLVAALAEGECRAELAGLAGQLRAWGGELIAEHVDSPHKAEALRRLGIPYAQGYWVTRFLTDASDAEFVHPGAGLVSAPATS